MSYVADALIGAVFVVIGLGIVAVVVYGGYRSVRAARRVWRGWSA